MFCLKELVEFDDMSAEAVAPWARGCVCLSETGPVQGWSGGVERVICDVVKTLQSVNVDQKAPLQGVTKKMCSAWTATSEQLDKITKENEKLRGLTEGVIQRVHKHERRRRGKSADPKLRPKIHAFVTSLTERGKVWTLSGLRPPERV